MPERNCVSMRLVDIQIAWPQSGGPSFIGGKKRLRLLKRLLKGAKEYCRVRSQRV